MKVDLDDLERKARAATPGPWAADATDVVSDLGSKSAWVERIGMANARKNVEHIVANSPPVTLALIARIRELENAFDTSLDEWNRRDEFDVSAAHRNLMRSLIEKGVVIA